MGAGALSLTHGDSATITSGHIEQCCNVLIPECPLVLTTRWDSHPAEGSRSPTWQSWAWHEPGWPWWSGNESQIATGAPHLPGNMGRLVASPVPKEPGLAISTPTFSFAVGYSNFTLIFRKAAEYRRYKVMDNPRLQYLWRIIPKTFNLCI